MKVFKDCDMKIGPWDEGDDHDNEGKSKDSHDGFAFFGVFRNCFEVESLEG